jgi:hypothetical protein
LEEPSIDTLLTGASTIAVTGKERRSSDAGLLAAHIAD